MSRFYELMADVNWKEYGGTWYSRRPYYGGTEWIVVELINWEDAQGEDMNTTGDPYRDYPNAYMGPRHDTVKGKARYAVQTTRFDTCYYSKEQIASAIESGMGKDALSEIKSRWHRRIMLVEQCVQYGYGDTIDIRHGNNARALLQAAKRAS